MMDTRKMETKRCPVCDQEMPAAALFCVSCGNKIVNTQPRIRYEQNSFSRAPKKEAIDDGMYRHLYREREYGDYHQNTRTGRNYENRTDGTYARKESGNNKRNMIKVAAIIAAAAIAGGTVLASAAPDPNGNRAFPFAGSTKKTETATEKTAVLTAEPVAVKDNATVKKEEECITKKKDAADKGTKETAKKKEKSSPLKVIVLKSDKTTEKEKTTVVPVPVPNPAPAPRCPVPVVNPTYINNTAQNAPQKVNVNINTIADFGSYLIRPISYVYNEGKKTENYPVIVSDAASEDMLVTAGVPAEAEEATEEDVLVTAGVPEEAEEAVVEDALVTAAIQEEAEEAAEKNALVTAGVPEVEEAFEEGMTEEAEEEETEEEIPEGTDWIPEEEAWIPEETEEVPEEEVWIPEEEVWIPEETEEVPEGEAWIPEEEVWFPEETAEETVEETAYGLSNQELAQKAKAYYQQTIGDPADVVSVQVDGGSGGCLGPDGSWTPGTDSSLENADSVFIRIYDQKCVENGGNGTLMTYTVDREGNITENW